MSENWLERLQKARAVEVSLEPLGLPEFYVKLIDPRTKPFGWFESSTRASPRPPTTEEEILRLPAEEVEKIHQEAKNAAADLIIEWNITNPHDGAILPIPKDDPSVWDVLPMEILGFIIDQMRELIRSVGPQRKRGH